MGGAERREGCSARPPPAACRQTLARHQPCRRHIHCVACVAGCAARPARLSGGTWVPGRGRAAYRVWVEEGGVWVETGTKFFHIPATPAPLPGCGVRPPANISPAPRERGAGRGALSTLAAARQSPDRASAARLLSTAMLIARVPIGSRAADIAVSDPRPGLRSVRAPPSRSRAPAGTEQSRCRPGPPPNAPPLCLGEGFNSGGVSEGIVVHHTTQLCLLSAGIKAENPACHAWPATCPPPCSVRRV